MKYVIKRIDLTVAREFARPAFELPARTQEIFRSLFDSLSPRFTLRLEDTKSIGGTSYGDVKLVLTAFQGAGHLEVTPAGFSCVFANLIQADDDVRTLLDFVETSESALRSVITELEFKGRLFRARTWLQCDGGIEAVDRALSERGNKALNLDAGEFQSYRKQFALQTEMTDEAHTLRIRFVVERSERPVSENTHLFVDGTFIFASTHELSGLREQFERGRELYASMLAQLGFQSDESRP